jgi:hypothetical protein
MNRNAIFLEQCYQRAEYYIWSALRGHCLPGGDPLTGRPRGRYEFPSSCGESLAAYKAMGRYWLEQLRQRREGGAR